MLTLSSRLRPNLASTTSRAAHFQFVPETPNPADGILVLDYWDWKWMQYFQSVVRDIFNSWFLVWLSSNLVSRPNWKDDASSVSHWCTRHCPHQGFILLSTNPYNPDREKCSHDKFSQDSTAVIFGEDVAFGGVFRCTVNCFTHFPLIFSKHQLYLILIEHLWPHSICQSINLI